MYFLEFMKSFIFLKEILDHSTYENLFLWPVHNYFWLSLLTKKESMFIKITSLHTKDPERITTKSHVLST